MKAYLITTGALFALIVIMHVLRAVQEGAHVTHDPFFIVLTLIAAGLSVWAWRLFAKISKTTA